jgi:hypothetical protein
MYSIREQGPTLLKMTRTEGLSTGSFVRRAHSTKMNGTMTSIMVTLLLMMLLLWQQNCRLFHGHNLTSHPSCRCMMGTWIQSNSWWATRQQYPRMEAMPLSWQSPSSWILKRGPDMVLLSSARNNYIMAEAQGHASHLFPRFSDETNYCSVLVSMHTRPWGISSGVCPKVFAPKSTSAHSAQWNCHWGHDQGTSARTYNSIFCQEAPQTLEKLLQKMDEYIWADNDFRQRREEAYRFSEWPGASEGDFIPGMSDQFITLMPMMKGLAMFSIAITVLSLRACNRLLSYHQFREAEEEEVLVEESSAINPESCTVFFVARTRATQQGHARSQFRSRRKLLKPRRDRVSRSKSSTLLRVILHTS